MGEKINFIKRFFWLKQASIYLHDIPKNAKIQNLGGKFSTFGRKKIIKNHDFGFLKIKLI